MSVSLAILVDVPNPAPVDPTGGAPGVGLLLAYLKWGALVVCGGAAVASFAVAAYGQLGDRPGMATKGWISFVVAFAATVGVALAIPTVNNVFHAVS